MQTELECRRLIILLFFDPNKTLEESAHMLSTFSKVAGQRSRIVIVIPNPGDYADIYKEDGIDVQAPGKDDKAADPKAGSANERYDVEGNQVN